MITEIEDYFTKGCGRCARFDTPDCSALLWSGVLAELRGLCLAAGLTETVRWGHPCYCHAGRNIAVLGAFRGDARISFFQAALMTDPAGVLEKPGPNTRHANMIRVSDAGQIAPLAPVIRAYLAEAMHYAEDGVTPPKASTEVSLPDELVETLDADPELAEAFHALTPGRQRSYVIALTSAKKPETRHARIAKARDRILAGKGAQER